MNDSDLRQLADAAAQALRPHLERSEALRRTVALIGRWLCEEAERIAAGMATRNEPIAPSESTVVDSPVAAAIAKPELPGGVAIHAAPAGAPAAAAPAPARPSALVPLKLGGAVIQVPLSGTAEELSRARMAAIEPRRGPDGPASDFAGRPDVDLAVIEVRCRLKAASCRLFIEKRAAGGNLDAEQEVLRLMNEMIAKAKVMPNCFLWVFWRDRTPPDDATLARIADNYDAHAGAVAVMRRIDESSMGGQSDDEAAALHLLAEANSALRVALSDTWLTSDDRDQAEAHIWLRRETPSRRVFIERHMTVDDPADPAGADDLRARIGALRTRLDERAARAKGVKSILAQIKYHARQIARSGRDDSADAWSKIADAVARLEGMGIAATDRRIAEAVGPEAASLWPASSADAGSMAVVVGRVKALALDSDTDGEDEPVSGDREWSRVVLEARGLLRGKRMIVVGGERNGFAVERLIQAFELADAEWVALAEHGSSTPMRAPINRADTAVVVVIVKLAGHLHAEEARDYANAAGKPCVLLSGGYNPERVAAAIMDQASGRLQR